MGYEVCWRVTNLSGDVVCTIDHKEVDVEVQAAFGNPSAPTVIRFYSDTGVIEAGADPRRGRYAVAW